MLPGLTFILHLMRQKGLHVHSINLFIFVSKNHYISSEKVIKSHYFKKSRPAGTLSPIRFTKNILPPPPIFFSDCGSAADLGPLCAQFGS